MERVLRKVAIQVQTRLNEESKRLAEEIEKKDASRDWWVKYLTESTSKAKDFLEKMDTFQTLKEACDFDYHIKELIYAEVINMFEALDTLGLFDSISTKRRHRATHIYVSAPEKKKRRVRDESPDEPDEPDEPEKGDE